MTTARSCTGLLVFFLIATPLAIFSQGDTPYANEEEQYRPHFHFSAKNNWINDPNGMFFLNGTYHLYFQYHPFSNVWGPMHWGHATSSDLIHWEEQKIALYPDELGTIFSGSAVVDHHNRSGFGVQGKTPVVAVYTNHDHQGEGSGRNDYQTQSIAYSLDEGYHWVKYAQNPVLSNPDIPDFRDPKAFWDSENDQWTMALAVKNVIQFYSSDDLKKWELRSEFGKDIGNHKGVWECPELFQLPIAGTFDKKWVLLVSVNPGAPNGGSGTQYFVGDWDGTHFNPDPDFTQSMSQTHNFWMDYGKDNYASVSFDNLPHPQGKRVVIGWMSNWEYARLLPTKQWKNQMTIARELDLIPDGHTFRLRSQPTKNLYDNTTLKKTWEKPHFKEKAILTNSQEVSLDRLLLKATLVPEANQLYTWHLSSPAGDQLTFGYDQEKNEFFINRSGLMIDSFSQDFAAQKQIVTRTAQHENIQIEVILDKTSIELFFDGGQTVLSALFFGKAPFDQLSLSSTVQEVVLERLELWEITSTSPKI